MDLAYETAMLFIFVLFAVFVGRNWSRAKSKGMNFVLSVGFWGATVGFWGIYMKALMAIWLRFGGLEFRVSIQHHPIIFVACFGVSTLLSAAFTTLAIIETADRYFPNEEEDDHDTGENFCSGGTTTTNGPQPENDSEQK